jgi:urease accessory protein
MSSLVWQLIDSGFPSGGFAHSAGLEASAQHGAVFDLETVTTFARQTLAQAGRTSLPLMTAAHSRSRDLAELDALADVFLSNPVANRASRAQGRALLMSTARSFSDAPLSAIVNDVRGGRIAAHHAPVFGAVFRALEIGRRDSQRAFLFITLRSVTSAAVRLGLVGGYEAQTILSLVSANIDPVIGVCGGLGPRDIAQTAPLVDLFQSTHDRLYSRLFQS